MAPWEPDPEPLCPPPPACLRGGRGVSERTRVSAGVSRSDIPKQNILSHYSFTENQRLINTESEFFTNMPIISQKAGISAA